MGGFDAPPPQFPSSIGRLLSCPISSSSISIRLAHVSFMIVRSDSCGNPLFASLATVNPSKTRPATTPEIKKQYYVTVGTLSTNVNFVGPEKEGRRNGKLIKGGSKVVGTGLTGRIITLISLRVGNEAAMTKRGSETSLGHCNLLRFPLESTH